MFKWAGIVLIILHAFIHLLGVDARQNAQGHQLTGVIWYLPFVLFLLTAVAVSFDETWWWIIALLAIAVSQVLIINQWHESKAGTLINILIVVFVVIAIGHWSFRDKVRKEIVSLFSLTLPERLNFKDSIAKVNDLPKPVLNWLTQSGTLFQERTHFVHLHQQGFMRTTPTDSWLPFHAEQYFAVDKPGFVWNAKVKVSGPLYLVARDKFENAKGSMLIKFLSVITIANATVKEMDQGAAVRFLAEIIWFPSAALSPYIQWKEVSPMSATATLNYKGISVTGLFTFNERGEVIAFDAERYMEKKGNYTPERWHISNFRFTELNGIRIPAESEITWKLKQGDFTWCKLKITDIEYNAFVKE